MDKAKGAPNPSVSEISTSNSLPWLMELHKSVNFQIEQIKADLEFPDNRDEDWTRRAKRALVYQRIILDNINRRVKVLSGKYPDAYRAVGVANEKTRNKFLELMAKNEGLALAEQKEKNRLNAVRALVAYKLDYAMAFYKAAKEYLTADTFAIISTEATEAQRKKIEREKDGR